MKRGTSGDIAAKRGKGIKRARFWVLALIVLVGSSILIGGNDNLPDPYAPDSAKPNGTKAMATLVQELGAKFETSSVGPENGTALVLRDTLSIDETIELEKWVEAGGTLVVADMNSSFALKARLGNNTGSDPDQLEPSCDEPIAEGVAKIEPDPDGIYNILKPTTEELRNSEGCFPVDDASYVIVNRSGFGQTIVVGGQSIFTNEQIGKLDNSVLVANLLDARDGQTVSFMDTAGGAPTGRKEPLELLPERARNVIWQLGLAGLLLIVWRWRRLGRPILEPQPVEIPASSLVNAVGSMLQSGGRDAKAAQLLREDLRRVLTQRFGLPLNTDADVIAQVVARHTRLDAAMIRSTLRGTANTGEGLVKLAQHVEHIRQSVTQKRSDQ